MYRSAGWRFLAAGRALERAMNTASLVASLVAPTAPIGAFEAALDCADSKLAHQKKYAFAMSCETVTSFLCLDRANPRSMVYQLEELNEHLLALPVATRVEEEDRPAVLLAHIVADFCKLRRKAFHRWPTCVYVCVLTLTIGTYFDKYRCEYREGIG